MKQTQPPAEPQSQGPAPQAIVFLRLPAVIRMTGLGRSTIYRMVAENKFPRPVLLAVRAVAWRKADIDDWSAGRPLASPH